MVPPPVMVLLLPVRVITEGVEVVKLPLATDKSPLTLKLLELVMVPVQLRLLRMIPVPEID